MVAGVTLLSLFSYGVLSLGSFGLLCVCLFFVYVDGRVLDLTGGSIGALEQPLRQQRCFGTALLAAEVLCGFVAAGLFKGSVCGKRDVGESARVALACGR